jgi:hypothetical protein
VEPFWRVEPQCGAGVNYPEMQVSDEQLRGAKRELSIRDLVVARRTVMASFLEGVGRDSGRMRREAAKLLHALRRIFSLARNGWGFHSGLLWLVLVQARTSHLKRQSQMFSTNKGVSIWISTLVVMAVRSRQSPKYRHGRPYGAEAFRVPFVGGTWQRI